jgi:hypothetical protein
VRRLSQPELYATRLGALAASTPASPLDAGAAAQLVGQLVHFMRVNLAQVRVRQRPVSTCLLCWG